MVTSPGLARIRGMQVLDWLVKYGLGAFNALNRYPLGLGLSSVVTGLIIVILNPELRYYVPWELGWSSDVVVMVSPGECYDEHEEAPRLPSPRDPLEALGLAVSCGSLWGMLSVFPLDPHRDDRVVISRRPHRASRRCLSLGFGDFSQPSVYWFSSCWASKSSSGWRQRTST